MKLLHERLREHHNADGCFKLDDMYVVIADRQAKALADEIERYYIPLPMFEDGEPAQWHDELENGEPLCAITFDDGGVVSINSETVNPEYELIDDETLKRPQPKVLDADGIEINVGDTVWEKDATESVPMEVTDIYGSKVVKCDDDERGWMGELLTHKEPDSLEKLRDDMKAWLEYPPMEADGIAIGKWRDRLSALIERGA